MPIFQGFSYICYRVEALKLNKKPKYRVFRFWFRLYPTFLVGKPLYIAIFQEIFDFRVDLLKIAIKSLKNAHFTKV